MKQILILALMLSTFSPLAAQKEYKRRHGPYLIFGPVHIIREEPARLVPRMALFAAESVAHASLILTVISSRRLARLRRALPANSSQSL
jgi:hypothetical protein